MSDTLTLIILALPLIGIWLLVIRRLNVASGKRPP